MKLLKKGMELSKACVKNFIKEEDGVGVVEIILILVILIGLVVIFKSNITQVVQNALNAVSTNSNSIIGK